MAATAETQLASLDATLPQGTCGTCRHWLRRMPVDSLEKHSCKIKSCTQLAFRLSEGFAKGASAYLEEASECIY